MFFDALNHSKTVFIIMTIGIVTTWFERGAAYVSKIYADALEQTGHKVYIYARGGEDHPSKKDAKWNDDNVTRDDTFNSFNVNMRKFYAWIKRNKLDCVLFNEQQDFLVVAKTKKRFPSLKLGAYIDYYTERTIPWFNMYDFVLCNTKRHCEAMKKHSQKFYIKWGTDTELYNNVNSHSYDGKVVFFHSCGMSLRKGTDILINAFINGKLYNKSRLVIHTQLPIEKVCGLNSSQLIKFNIQVIEKTVTAPGLYYMGDVYVYPTRLDGLGLTMYEALSSGLPVITTDFPPMNETVNDKIGKLISVRDFYCRQDAYYYPMALCDERSLIKAMNWYIENPDELQKHKKEARAFAIANYDIKKKYTEISKAFEEATVRPFDKELYRTIKHYYLINKPSFFQRIIERRKFLKILRFFLKK